MDQTIETIVNLPWRKILISGAAAFAAYAVYFDYKRTTHPDYQKHIRENRAKKNKSTVSAAQITLPNLNNPEEVQAFFLQEVQIGEEMMASGNPAMVAEGAEHLAYAVLLCGQSEQLLAIFQQTFPPNHYQLVLSKLQVVKERVGEHISRGGFNRDTGDQGPTVQPIDDDDLE